MLIKNRKDKIYIFGAGIVAKVVIDIVRLELGDNSHLLNGCIVTNPQVNPPDLDGIEVVGLNTLSEEQKKACIIIATREKYHEDIEKELISLGCYNYKKIRIADCIDYMEKVWAAQIGDCREPFLEQLKSNPVKDEEYLLFLGKQTKKKELTIEVNISDHCNLNCQSCNHFSPIARPHFIDETLLYRDLKRIHTLFGDRINRIMLLGGEPLLNPNIVSIMNKTREIMKNIRIYIFTNGILFPQMGREFWETCKRNNIGIKVTRYPINVDYDYWFEHAKSIGVVMVDENPEPIKTTYRLPIREKGNLNAYYNYIRCYHANYCCVLREGRIYTCPISAWIDHLNAFYDKKFPETVENSISIYKVSDADTILRFLRQPVKMCEYCDVSKYEYNLPCHTSKKALTEWVETI